MQGRFKMEHRLFTIVRYNYRDYICIYTIYIDYWTLTILDFTEKT
jgi:hypothetical protein